jgi:hypothetical protein
MYANIPNELKSLKQWICWRRVPIPDTEKTTKIPINPYNGWNASVSVPEHWSDFETAVRASVDCDGIGFVFTARDPYCGIDLDAPKEGAHSAAVFARQQKIFQAIPSYAERSPSKNGLHIICRASVPKGRKREAIEIYSQERYFTFTGDVFNNAPIIDAQEVVTALWQEMGPGADADNYYLGSHEREDFNEGMIERMRAGANGDLFDQLFAGDWQNAYASQSEADQALMNIIAFYCDNRLQCIEIFRMSELGKRDKAQRDAYMNYTLDKAFDQKLPPIDMTAIIDNARKAIAAKKEQEKQEQIALRNLHSDAPINKAPWQSPPPGLFADITNFVLAQSPYPVPEIALTAAIGFLAGIVGRAYNVQSTGLNQYVMLLAPTGRGKEAMSSGINKLMSGVAYQECPEIWQFLGPADIASGAALLKFLAKEERIPCCVAITGEVGIRLQQMSSANAHAGDTTLLRVLLDLYSKSGHGQSARPMIYSDEKNNAGIINAPAFTWLGESTPMNFYRALSPEQIESGLIPRFLVTEYSGPRVTPNANIVQFPPADLVEKIKQLVKIAVDASINQGKIDVQFTADAAHHSEMIRARIDTQINANDDGPYTQLLNREHLKTIRLAALVAVTHNFYNPCITIPMLDWAYAIVNRGTMLLNEKFMSGEIGGEVMIDDLKQFHTLIKMLRTYVNGKYSLDNDERKFQENMVVSQSTFSRLARPISAFRRDRRGGKIALDQAINDCIAQSILLPIPPRQATAQFGVSAKLYAINVTQMMQITVAN